MRLCRGSTLMKEYWAKHIIETDISKLTWNLKQKTRSVDCKHRRVEIG